MTATFFKTLNFPNFRISVNSKGFTMIEILVGVAVMVLLAVLALVSLRTFRQQVGIDSEAQGVMSILRLARSQTLGSDGEASYGVHFETDKYVLFTGPTYDDAATSNKEYSLAETEIYDINLTGGGSEVTFDRVRGTTGEDGDIRLRLLDDNSRTTILKINSSGQISLNDNLTQLGTRVVDSRHLHFDLGWSIQTANTLTFSFSDSTPVTQNITMAGFFDAPKSEFDWSGSIDVNGTDQELRVHTHFLDSTNTTLSVHRDLRYNSKGLTISIDGDEIVSYTAAGVATIEAFGGTLTPQ